MLREVTEEDIIRLTEIKIKRISKYNSFKADELMRDLQNEIDTVQHNLTHLTEYAIGYFENLRKKYGKGKERRTEIRSFDNIQVAKVAAANCKLFVNRKEGFVGFGLKKDELISECSDIDDIIVFLRSGIFKVVKVADKVYVGKDIIHAAVWKKNDERMVYNMVYYDAGSGKSFAKRFNITSITRERDYHLTRGAEGSKVLYFSANPNSESEIVRVYLSPNSRARKKVFDFDFGQLAVKGRGSQGNVLTKYAVRRISRQQVGASTKGSRKIWFDETIGRLNTDGRGKLLGEFDNGDLILSLYKDGTYILNSYELNTHFDIGKLLHIEKFQPDKTISAVYYDGKSKNFFVKRFKVEALVNSKIYKFISEHKQSALLVGTTQKDPLVEVEYLQGKANKKVTMQLHLNEVVDVKGWKAKGNRLSTYRVTFVELVSKEEEIPQTKNDQTKKSVVTKSAPENNKKKTSQADLFTDKE